jgi:hypothetical protein
MPEKTIAELEAELKAAEAEKAPAEAETPAESTGGVEQGVDEEKPVDEGHNYVATPENDGHPGYSPPDYSDIGQ